MVGSTERIEFLDKFQQGIHRWNVTIWSEVRRAVFNDVSCLEYSWKIFVANTNGRVGLVVFKQDIIARLVFLDEVVFQ